MLEEGLEGQGLKAPNSRLRECSSSTVELRVTAGGGDNGVETSVEADGIRQRGIYL